MLLTNFYGPLGLEKNLHDQEKMGIWNGDEFIFIESGWSLMSLMKILYRYGFQPFTLKRYLKIM